MTEPLPPESVVTTPEQPETANAAETHYLDTCTLLQHEPGKCNACGTPLTGRRKRWCSDECADTISREHFWQIARYAALRRDGHRCVREGCGARTGLEVNHIEPRNGQGYNAGCHHHLSNLETLCQRHHREVTNAQAAARRAAS